MEQAQKVEDLVNFQPITRCACWNTYNCVWWGSFQLLKRQLELKDVGFCWGGGEDCSCCCCVYGWKYRVDKVKVRSSLTIPPTCVSSFNSTTLMFTVTFWKSSKLSSGESVMVLDAVAMSAINDETSNFLGGCLISVDVFSITSYPSPLRAGLTSQVSSATAMFLWW